MALLKVICWPGSHIYYKSANSSILGNSDLTFVDRKLGKCAFGSDSVFLI